jgi:hypothetical protein
MSELGAFSARSSTVGAARLSRPRVIVIAMGALSLAAWFSVAHRSVVALVVATAWCAASIGPRERSLAEIAARGIGFLTRSRWTKVATRRTDESVTIAARGQRRSQLFAFSHHGRLDLSGQDRAFDANVAALLERVASNGGGVVSWHLLSSNDRSTTLIALEPGTRVPQGFSPLNGSVRLTRGSWLFERWRYVRDEAELIAVFSVTSSSAAMGEPVLRTLIPFASHREAAVLVRVSSSSRASSVVGRHTHRWRANVALAALGGFRQRASTESATQLLERREREVALGRALCEVEIFVTVRANTPRALERAARELREDARRVGARLERGDGRHALWFCAQLPGAVGWRAA